MGHRHVRKTWRFLRERQERVTFSTAEVTARVLAQEKNHEGENEAKADDDGKGNDGHGSRD